MRGLPEKNKRLVGGIKAYFSGAGAKKAVLGMSGGVDSALTAALAAEALGAKNLTALIMPDGSATSKKSTELARNFAGRLGINCVVQPIARFLKPFSELKWRQSRMAGANLRARVRALLLYNYANSNNALVLGASNKSELMLGYFTKYGDSAADVIVLGALYKTEVLELARFKGLPAEITEREPTAELWAGQTDAKELGAGYRLLDPILKAYERGKTGRIGGMSPCLVKKVLARVKKNEHKRKPAYVVPA